MEYDEDRISRQTKRVLQDATRSLSELYKREMKDVVTQNSNLRRAHDELCKENFAFQQRVNALSRQLGYESFVEAEQNLPEDASQRLSSTAETAALEMSLNDELMARITHLQEKIIAAKDENRNHLDHIHRLQQALDLANQRVHLVQREKTTADEEAGRKRARLSELETRLDNERQVYEKSIARKNWTIQELESKMQTLESHVPHTILKAVSNLSSLEDKENITVKLIPPEQQAPQILTSPPTPDKHSSSYEVRYKELVRQHSHLQQLYDQLRTKVESGEQQMFELKNKFKLANHRWTTSRKRWEACKESMVNGLTQQNLKAKGKRQLNAPKGTDPSSGPSKPKEVDIVFWQGRLGEMDALDKDVDAASEMLMDGITGDVMVNLSPSAKNSHPSKRIRVEQQTEALHNNPSSKAKQTLPLYSQSTPVKRSGNVHNTRSPISPSSLGTATESEPPLTRHQQLQLTGSSPAYRKNPSFLTGSPLAKQPSPSMIPKLKAFTQRDTPTTPQRSTDKRTPGRTHVSPPIKTEPLDDMLAASHSTIQPAAVSKLRNHNRAQSSPPTSPGFAGAHTSGTDRPSKTVLGKRKSDASIPSGDVSMTSRLAPHEVHRPTYTTVEESRDISSSANIAGPSSKSTDTPASKEKSMLIQDLKNMPSTEYMKAYAPFKGHGRYGKTKVTNPNHQPMSTVYEIRRAQNDGLDYQYDSVVRNKEQRKKLDATDCECCKEYYTTVGQLDAVTRGPVWRSPSQKQPPAKRPCIHDKATPASPQRVDSMSISQQEDLVAEHQREISRHRHQWARPRTPPGYWNIGFPSTQELAEINRRADENDRAKQRLMEKESRKPDGRYQKRIP